MSSMSKRNITRLVAITKLRFDRGYAYAKYIRDLLMIGTALKYLSFPIWLIVPIGILCYAVGYLDERYGIWKMTAEYSYQTLNPFFKELDRKINKLLKR